MVAVSLKKKKVDSVVLVRTALTETGDSAKSKLAAGTGVCHLMLVIALYFMVFKP